MSSQPIPLSDTQDLDQSGDELMECIDRFLEFLQTHPSYNTPSPDGVTKRMLPAVPGSVVARAHTTFTRGLRDGQGQTTLLADGQIVTTPRPYTATTTRHNVKTISHRRSMGVERTFSSEC